MFTARGSVVARTVVQSLEVWGGRGHGFRSAGWANTFGPGWPDGTGQTHMPGNGVRHAGMAWSVSAGTLGAMQFAEGDTAAEPPKAVLQGHSEKTFLHASARLVNAYVRLPCVSLTVRSSSRSISIFIAEGA